MALGYSISPVKVAALFNRCLWRMHGMHNKALLKNDCLLGRPITADSSLIVLN